METLSLIIDLIVCAYVVVGSLVTTNAIIDFYIAGKIKKKSARQMAALIDSIPEMTFKEVKDICNDSALDVQKVKSFAKQSEIV